jgi:hypothetical protein
MSLRTTKNFHPRHLGSSESQKYYNEKEITAILPNIFYSVGYSCYFQAGV